MLNYIYITSPRFRFWEHINSYKSKIIWYIKILIDDHIQFRHTKSTHCCSEPKFAFRAAVSGSSLGGSAAYIVIEMLVV